MGTLWPVKWRLGKMTVGGAARRMKSANTVFRPLDASERSDEVQDRLSFRDLRQRFPIDGNASFACRDRCLPSCVQLSMVVWTMNNEAGLIVDGGYPTV